MRIAVVSAPSARGKPVPCVAALVKGMEAMGHRVDVVDAWTEDGGRLPGYGYVAVVAEAVSLFGGKMPVALATLLSGTGALVGKKSAAFLCKTTPLTGKALANLMKMMEKEGMYINWFDILVNAAQAEAVGKRIGA